MKKNNHILQEIEDIFSRKTIVEVLPSIELFKKKLLSGDILTFYIGFDATAPTLHLSHAKNIILLERFRKLGHKVVLLFGDFTAMIGDPSGESSQRKQLSHKEVMKNIFEWKKQIAPLMDFNAKENPPQVRYNSEWLSQLTFDQIIRLASHFTVQQMLERDMFEKRIKKGDPIYLHEFFYPLMQGYDSVALDADVELCGTDQIFNALAGRTLLKKYSEKEKFVVAVTLMEDPETGELMSKSKGTGVFLNTSARDMFGQIMAQKDSMMENIFRHCTNIPLEEIHTINIHPRDTKLRLAYEVVALFYGRIKAQKEKEYFIQTFSKKMIDKKNLSSLVVKKNEMLLDILVRFQLAKSKNEARKKIQQGGVSLGEEKVVEESRVIKISDHNTVLRVGKKNLFLISIQKNNNLSV